MVHILVADDDKNIASLIGDSLSDEGFAVMVAENGNEALSLALKHDFDLMLLDIMMPGEDGLTICRKIRDKVSCPILFVTAKVGTVNTVLGLEIGADDYITKPFVVEELVAKVKAHIRRDKRNTQMLGEIIEFGEFKIAPQSFEVTKNGMKIELTTREFQLFQYLYENLNIVLTREQIFDHVWGLDYSDIGGVNVAIKSLRDKLDHENRYIKTIWGVGYKLCRGDAL